MKTKIKVLVVAPGRRSKGGISVAVAATLNSSEIASIDTVWIETMDDRSSIHKMLALFTALMIYIIKIPFFDIVHVHTSSGTSFYRKSLFMAIAILFRKPFILHIHPSHFIKFVEKSGRISKWYIQRFSQLAAAVIALSAGTARSLQSLLNVDSVEVLPNPCPYSVISQNEDKSNPPEILFAGKLMAAKGCFELINAFAQVKAKLPKSRLVMAGNGEVQRFRKFAEVKGLGDYITFTGWIDEDDLLSSYRRATVFCLPSHSEGLPVSILEAMSQGLTVIATPVGGVPDIIKHGYNGILVPVMNESALADSLIFSLSNEQFRSDIGKNATDTIKNNYSKEIIGRKLLSIYMGLLSARV